MYIVDLIKHERYMSVYRIIVYYENKFGPFHNAYVLKAVTHYLLVIIFLHISHSKISYNILVELVPNYAAI